ncbi:MAG TPA: ClbS/DfsB family four-helix bundle protein [Levilinea sp.]|nr:ClbS/DfsB family four-helix bundle protein [Levilinea sp.]
MDKKIKLLKLLSLAHQEENQFVDSLSDEEKNEMGRMDYWSAKDTLAHNTFWKQRRADQIAAPDNPTLTGFRDFDQINAQVYVENHRLTWSNVLENAREAYQYLAARVEALDPYDLHNPDLYPWLNGRPLWRMVANSGYNHPLNHIAGYHYRRDRVQQASDMQEATAARLQEFDDDPEWCGIILYNLACFYATTARPQQAVQRLKSALRLSPGLVEWAQQDIDLAILSGTAQYEELFR